MSSSYRREISDNERVYLELNKRIALPVIQFVVEYEGILDLNNLRRAVESASEAMPDARLIQSKQYWVDSGEPPPVKEVSELVFDGFDFYLSEKNKQIFGHTMNPSRGPNAEIVMLQMGTNQFALVFRVFHGLMDGQGVLLWIKNIFKALRRESLVLARTTETDLAFLRRHDYTKLQEDFKFDCKPTPLHRPIGISPALNFHKEALYWKRISLKGNHFGVLAKIISGLSKYYEGEQLKFVIPCDIRRYQSGYTSTGNLTLPYYLKVTKHAPWMSIYRQILQDLEQRKDLNIHNADYGVMIKWPSFILQGCLRSLLFYQALTGRYLNGGTITSLGKMVLEDLSTEQASAKTLYSLPTHQPLVPFSIATTDNPFSTEISFSSYRHIIDEALADELLQTLAEELRASRRTEDA